MARTISYQILDKADGRFTVVVTMAPDRIYRRDDLATLGEAEEWVDGLRALMAGCGAPVVRDPGCAGPHQARPIAMPEHPQRRASPLRRRRRIQSVTK